MKQTSLQEKTLNPSVLYQKKNINHGKLTHWCLLVNFAQRLLILYCFYISRLSSNIFYVKYLEVSFNNLRQSCTRSKYKLHKA